jgi:hypothetical protein
MDFKFAIGDYVALKAHMELYGLRHVQPLVVVSVETAGIGGDGLYACRAFSPPQYTHLDYAATFVLSLFKASEAELIALDVKEYRKSRSAKLEDRQKEVEQEYAELYGAE